MDDQLRNTFNEVQKALASALINYSFGKSSENWKLVRSGQESMIGTKMQELVDQVRHAIHKRLRYAEIDKPLAG